MLVKVGATILQEAARELATASSNPRNHGVTQK